MVLPLLALPLELQANVLRLLDDVTTAGRLAQTCRSGKQLLQLAATCGKFIEAERNELEAKRNELRAAAASRYTLAAGRLRSKHTLRGLPMLCPFTIAVGAATCIVTVHTGVVPAIPRGVHLFLWTIRVAGWPRASSTSPRAGACLALNRCGFNHRTERVKEVACTAMSDAGVRPSSAE